MSFIRDIYGRFAVLIHEIIKFGIVGGVGFVVQLGVTDALHLEGHVGPLTSEAVGYVLATVVTFLGNRYWAFNRRRGAGLGHETVVFALLNGVALGIQEAVVAIVHYGLGLTDPLSFNIATIVGVGLGTIFRLWSYRKWVFSTPRESSSGAENDKEPTPVG